MKKFVLAAVSAAAMITAAAPASAAVIITNLGTVSVPDSRFGGSQIAADADLVSIYQFNTTASGFMTFSSFTSANPAVQFTSAAIYQGTLTTTPNASNTLVATGGTQETTTTGTQIGVGATFLNAGSYSFVVRGAAPSPTSLGYSINFMNAAVPEPATWGLMLLGFGMVGMGLRSRRNARVTFA